VNYAAFMKELVKKTKSDHMVRKNQCQGKSVRKNKFLIENI